MIDLVCPDPEFFQACKQKIEDSGFSLTISYDLSEPYSYFSDDEKMLRVVARENWYPTFVHEYCHFEQHLDGMVCQFDGLECFEVMENWFAGREYPESTIKEVMHIIAMDELDCEKRVIRKIRENKLSIDEFDYARQANTYIASYYIMIDKRKWLSIAPYYLKSWFPPTLDINHKTWAWALSDRFQSVFV